jgi:hypothetical protein
MSLNLMAHYADPEFAAWFEAAWRKAGKRWDAGKACVRFRTLEDVPLAVVADAIRRMPVERYIQLYESAIRAAKSSRGKRAKKPKAAAKPVRKQAGSRPAKGAGRTASKSQRRRGSRRET